MGLILGVVGLGLMTRPPAASVQPGAAEPHTCGIRAFGSEDGWEWAWDISLYQHAARPRRFEIVLESQLVEAAAGVERVPDPEPHVMVDAEHIRMRRRGTVDFSLRVQCGEAGSSEVRRPNRLRVRYNFLQERGSTRFRLGETDVPGNRLTESFPKAAGRMEDDRLLLASFTTRGVTGVHRHRIILRPVS